MFPEHNEKECWALLKFAQTYPSGNLANHCIIHIARNLLTFTCERKSWDWDNGKRYHDPILLEMVLGPNYLEELKIRDIFTSFDEMSRDPNMSDLGLMCLIKNEKILSVLSQSDELLKAMPEAAIMRLHPTFLKCHCNITEEDVLKSIRLWCIANTSEEDSQVMIKYKELRKK